MSSRHARRIDRSSDCERPRTRSQRSSWPARGCRFPTELGPRDVGRVTPPRQDANNKNDEESAHSGCCRLVGSNARVERPAAAPQGARTAQIEWRAGRAPKWVASRAARTRS